MASHAVVVYHEPCTDGIFGAFAFHSLAAKSFKGVKYIPARPGSRFFDTIPETDQDDETDVFFIDVMPHMSELPKFSQRYHNVVLLDHHKTNIDWLNEFLATSLLGERHNIDNECDLSACGSMIALRYFSSFVNNKDELKAFFDKYFILFQHVQDYDMQQKELKETEIFVAGLDSKHFFSRYNINENPNIFNELAELDFETVLEWGKVFLEEQVQKLKEYADKDVVRELIGFDKDKRVRTLEIKKNEYFLINKLSESLLMKDSDEPRLPVAMIYREDLNNDKLCVFSLRSIAPFDCSKMAMKLGGGGHAQSSGFTIPKENFEKIFLPQ